ncbi:hypothetical protein MJ561_04175 [Klebsiella pneumoniae]|nr:hypothetical protein MJ561_04175 [Klebsiella pneumoniae]
MRQRGDLVGGQAGDFHHRLAGNAVGQHPLGNAQRLGMLSFTLPFLRPTSCNLSAIVINLPVLRTRCATSWINRPKRRALPVCSR